MMNRKLLVGIVFRISMLGLVAFPVTTSLIGAALLHTLYGWEWRGFMVVIAGILGTVAMVVALLWILADCDAEIQAWLAAIGKETKEPTPTPGSWAA
jgi:MFS family permease